MPGIPWRDGGGSLCESNCRAEFQVFFPFPSSGRDEEVCRRYIAGAGRIMSFQLKKLLRRGVDDLKAYVPGRRIEEVADEYGLSEV